jgi:hypothetical protein
MTVLAGELKARRAFDFELNQEMAFLERQPSVVLATVEELLKLSIGGERFFRSDLSGGRCRILLCLVRGCPPGFTNGPAKGASAQLSGNGEGEVRAARSQFRRAEEFKKEGQDLLRDVVARKGREHGGNLTCGAMNGRNESQQEKALAKG